MINAVRPVRISVEERVDGICCIMCYPVKSVLYSLVKDICCVFESHPGTFNKLIFIE